MLSKREVEMLRVWDRAASVFRHRYLSHGNERFQFKDYAFRAVYGELIRQTIQQLPGRPNVLKTDLWNEGVEEGRRLSDFVHASNGDSILVCTDVSRYVCESANRPRNSDFAVVRATLLASPFRPVFDFIIDPSTVDHMPRNLRRDWMVAEASALKPNGFLLVSFDCRLNLFNELYHRIFTRKLYPEWTLAPSEIRAQLESLGFSIVREHAIFMAGFFWGTHRPIFPLARTLRRPRVFNFLKNMELSNRSRSLSFIAPQYVIVARKLTPGEFDKSARGNALPSA